MDEEERKAYEDYMVSVHVAKDNFETARTDGMIEGVRIGLKEGEEKGVEKGKKEREIVIARNLKGKIPNEIIIESTGLTAEEIDQL